MAALNHHAQVTYILFERVQWNIRWSKGLMLLTLLKSFDSIDILFRCSPSLTLRIY